MTVDSAIDRLLHSAEVAHCTHTTEPMASSSHSGGPTAFRRNQPTAMTLSRPLRPNPQRAGPGWPRVYKRHNGYRRGQNDPTRGPGTIISTTGTQGYACLPGQGKHDITFPSWRHRPEAMSMDRIKAFPQGKCGCTGKKLDSAAP